MVRARTRVEIAENQREVDRFETYLKNNIDRTQDWTYEM